MNPQDFVVWRRASGLRVSENRWTYLVARTEALGCFVAPLGKGAVIEQALILDLEPSGRRQRLAALKAMWAPAARGQSLPQWVALTPERVLGDHRAAALQTLAHAQAVCIERLQMTLALTLCHSGAGALEDRAGRHRAQGVQGVQGVHGT